VYVQETGIKFIRDQIILLAVCLIVMTIFFYGVVFFSPFVVSMDNAINYGFWIYYNISSIKTYYIVLPLVTASALTLVFFSFFNFRLGHTVHLFTDRRTDQTVTQINEILSDSLHSQKNLLFSINILARGAVEEAALAGGTGKLKEKIKKIDEISRSSLDKISEQLDSLRDIRIKVKNQGLVDLIERAAEKVNRPQHISIFKNYRARDRRDLVCRLDQFHIIQAFVNILTNAVEAIETASRDEGLIVITVTSQFQWVVVSIHDNGIGIRKKSLKHIFEPWYSEKGGSHNKGLGLSYVSKIIKAHNGFVQFESKYGEGTKVYIMVPKSGGRGERNG
jgi:signal transduction histidine kinase